MARKEISGEEAEAFCKRVYERKVRPTFKGAEEPIGLFLSVDLDSEDWELDEYHHKAARRLLERRPDADILTTRVGFPAAYISWGP